MSPSDCQLADKQGLLVVSSVAMIAWAGLGGDQRTRSAPLGLRVNRGADQRCRRGPTAKLPTIGPWNPPSVTRVCAGCYVSSSFDWASGFPSRHRMEWRPPNTWLWTGVPRWEIVV